MLPLMTGLLSGASNLVSSIFSSQTAAQNTQEQIANQQMMQLQSQNYNTTMSNTAYQRASQDMQAAGLNPAMMFSSGSAASSPTSSAPSMPTPQKTSPMAGLGHAVDAAMSTAIQAKTLDKMTEEVANLRADQARILAQVPLIGAQTGQARAGEILNIAHAGEAQERADRLRKLMPEAALIGDTAKNQMDTPMKRILDIGSYGGGKVGDIIAPVLHSADAVAKFRGLGLQRLRDLEAAKPKNYEESVETFEGGSNRYRRYQ